MSDSDEAPGPVEGSQGTPAKGKKMWVRGANASPKARALQFPGIMEVRGELMWCQYCDVSIDFKEKCTAANHLKSAKHKANVEDRKLVVKTPGCFCSDFFPLICVAISGPTYNQPLVEDPESQPTPKKLKTADLKGMFQGLELGLEWCSAMVMWRSDFWPTDQCSFGLDKRLRRVSTFHSLSHSSFITCHKSLVRCNFPDFARLAMCRLWHSVEQCADCGIQWNNVNFLFSASRSNRLSIFFAKGWTNGHSLSGIMHIIHHPMHKMRKTGKILATT